ncbi:hypothetical protein [Frankia sp. R43]|uniref:hypothetical protein n=1 Tax=Frankia sp. R43 TaxID=269536 RepID=UPI0009F8EC94|nr:hypothetical protein [Frankia sp. R43]
MVYPADLPYPVPEPHEWADEPEPGVARAFDEAMADVEEGGMVVCQSAEEFDALLAELVAEPHTSPRAS